MKAVLISIQPKWCELIASGKKTVEVRKTKPKIETPFKVYIYCTDQKWRAFFAKGENGNYNPPRLGNRKVIGEFVCDKMLESFLNNNDGWFIEKGCLTKEEIDEYQGDKSILYGWHISDLVIYDKPRELGEFEHTKEYVDKIRNSVVHWEYGVDDECVRPLKRPPQSWCYVEEGGAE